MRRTAKPKALLAVLFATMVSVSADAVVLDVSAQGTGEYDLSGVSAECEVEEIFSDLELEDAGSDEKIYLGGGYYSDSAEAPTAEVVESVATLYPGEFSEGSDEVEKKIENHGAVENHYITVPVEFVVRIKTDFSCSFPHPGYWGDTMTSGGEYSFPYRIDAGAYYFGEGFRSAGLDQFSAPLGGDDADGTRRHLSQIDGYEESGDGDNYFQTNAYHDLGYYQHVGSFSYNQIGTELDPKLNLHVDDETAEAVGADTCYDLAAKYLRGWTGDMGGNAFPVGATINVDGDVDEDWLPGVVEGDNYSLQKQGEYFSFQGFSPSATTSVPGEDELCDFLRYTPTKYDQLYDYTVDLISEEGVGPRIVSDLANGLDLASDYNYYETTDVINGSYSGTPTLGDPYSNTAGKTISEFSAADELNSIAYGDWDLTVSGITAKPEFVGRRGVSTYPVLEAWEDAANPAEYYKFHKELYNFSSLVDYGIRDVTYNITVRANATVTAPYEIVFSAEALAGSADEVYKNTNVTPTRSSADDDYSMVWLVLIGGGAVVLVVVVLVARPRTPQPAYPPGVQPYYYPRQASAPKRGEDPGEGERIKQARLEQLERRERQILEESGLE